MTKKTVFRSYKSKGFDWLLPIYLDCQRVFTDILNNSIYRKALLNMPLTKVTKSGKTISCPNGELWKDMANIIPNTLTDVVPNQAWYMRIIFYNIITLLRSVNEKRQIYAILEQYDFQINDDLRDELSQHDLYPTTSALRSLINDGCIPTLPLDATFRLDYSVSDKQMFKLDSKTMRAEIKLYSSKQAKKQHISAWKPFQIVIPSYIREQYCGKFSKPMFYYDKKLDQLVCQIAYEVAPIKHEPFENILGVDLGKYKVYSATVLYPSNDYSDEFVPSKELEKLLKKLENLNRNINSNYERHQLSIAYTDNLVMTNHQKRRYMNYVAARKKRTRLKKEIEWLVAEELCTLALKHNCQTIHLENLSWLESKAGKWNFSNLQKRIKEIAELFGIDVVCVNCKNTSKRHPLTGELGKSIGRNVVFSDNISVDRDQLASLNIALTQPKKKPNKVAPLRKRNSVKTTRPISRKAKNKTLKQKNNAIKQQTDSFSVKKRTNQIALFWRNQVNTYQALTIKLVTKTFCSVVGLESTLLPTGYLKVPKYTIMLINEQQTT